MRRLRSKITPSCVKTDPEAVVGYALSIQDLICATLNWNVFGLNCCSPKLNLLWSAPVIVHQVTDSNFFELLEVTLSKIRSDCELMLLGDLNLNFLRKNLSLFRKLVTEFELV